MPTIVVTGANNGIGFAFARLLVEEGYEVHATDVTIGANLQDLGCVTAQLDVSLPQSIEAFVSTLEGKPIDLLLNNAGVMAEFENDALGAIEQSVLQRTLGVNTFGPLLLTQALLPNLLKAKEPKIAMMSSRLGSIASNTTGGSYAYRASKAALNSICKSLAVDLKEKGVTVVVLHPGTVKTALDKTGTTQQSPEAVEADEAATKLYKVLLSKGLNQSGTFWHREGYEIPW